MEGNSRPVDQHPPPAAAAAAEAAEAAEAANKDCNRELTRSNSDASSLTAENCKNIRIGSANVTTDDGTAWTNEKHNLYLHHLEASFVKQLHQSKSLLEQKQRDMSISQKRLTDMKNGPEQFKVLRSGGWQKINYPRVEPLSGGSSADSCASLKRKWTYNFKRIGKHAHPPSAEMASSHELWSTAKHEKGTIPHGLATCSQECSSSDPYLGDLFDLKREGSGQNFLDEENQSTSNFESQAKRLKTALAENSLQDQIVPSTKRLTADYSMINSSTHGEKRAHHQSLSENFE